MPITQDRMLALIEAAEDYQHAALRLIEFIRDQRRNVESGTMTADQAFALIAIESSPQFILDSPQHSFDTIRDERRHFKRNKRANEHKAAKLRENRWCDRNGVPRPWRGDGRDGAQGVALRRLDPVTRARVLDDGPPVTRHRPSAPPAEAEDKPDYSWAARAAAISSQTELTADSELELDKEVELQAMPPPALASAPVEMDEIDRLIELQRQQEEVMAGGVVQEE